MRFLICGLGSVGRRHLRNLRTLGQEDIVLLRTGKSTLPDEDLTSLPVETDMEVALEYWSPEAVLVTNPTALHLEVAIPAARRGCHLLIEKPVSHSQERVKELELAVAEGHGQVLVGYQFRFHPGLHAVKALLDDDTIGEPISVHAHWGEYLPGWHPWEDYRASYSARKDLGGGVLLTLSHPLDYLRWFFGALDVEAAQLGFNSELDLEVESTAQVLLRSKARTLVSVYLDYNQQPPRHDLEIVGTTGTVRWSAADGAAAWWTESVQHWQRVDPPAGFERNQLFLDEMRHFLAVIQGEAAPVCSLEDGLKAMELALEARRMAGTEGVVEE